VCLNATCPNDIAEHKRTGYSGNPFSTEDLAEVIKWFINLNHEEYQNNYRQAREGVIQIFRYTCDNYDEILLRVGTENYSSLYIAGFDYKGMSIILNDAKTGDYWNYIENLKKIGTCNCEEATTIKEINYIIVEDRLLNSCNFNSQWRIVCLIRLLLWPFCCRATFWPYRFICGLFI